MPSGERHAARAWAARTGAALVTDDLPFLPVTIGEHLRALAPLYPGWDDSLATTLLARASLKREQWCDELTPDEAARLRLILVLVARPAVLLLDAPVPATPRAARRVLLRDLVGPVGGRAIVETAEREEDLTLPVTRVVHLDAGEAADGVRDGSPATPGGEGRSGPAVLVGLVLLYLRVAHGPRSPSRPAILLAALLTVGLALALGPREEGIRAGAWAALGLALGGVLARGMEPHRGLAWPGLPASAGARAAAAGVVGAAAWGIACGVGMAGRIVLAGAVPGLEPTPGTALGAAVAGAVAAAMGAAGVVRAVAARAAPTP